MIKAIIIDDEPSSRKTLSLMLDRYKEVIEVVDMCPTPLKDIEMPVLNGFEMLKKIDDINFEVIFTTAYDQYAINAIRFSALDYLLKPVSREDLKIAIDKCSKTISKKESQQ